MIIELLPFSGHSSFALSAEIHSYFPILQTTFFMTGDINLPEISTILGRGEKLYNDTCFELFVKGEGEEYFEYNLSPEGLWDGFSFQSYRKIIAPLTAEQKPFHLSSQKNEQRFEFIFEIDLRKLNLTSSQIFLSPTMVFKKEEDVLYFSGCHSENKPDFHAKKSFIHSLFLS